MSATGTGRARGRTRGRPRGGNDSVAPPRPGEPVSEDAPPPPQATATVAAPGAGRARTRGSGRPGPAVEDAAAGVAAMGLEERPRRQFVDEDDLVLRPHTAVNTRGEKGTPIQLQTNCFDLKTAPTWMLYQYHVSFSPTVDGKNVRQMLVKNLKEHIGAVRAFDGCVLFVPHKISNEALFTLPSQRKTFDPVNVTFKLTNELPPSSPTCMQVYNVIFKRVLRILEMTQVGRHYYSPSQSVMVPNHGLEVWPGFITAIQKFEAGVLLTAEVSNKIMQTATVLQEINKIGNVADVQKKIIGTIVMTKYNKKTYRVDDIDFSRNPLSTFQKRDKSEITFMEYYQTQYEESIRDSHQPLLISKPKKI